MPSNKSANSSGTPIRVTIRDAVEEFIRIKKALLTKIPNLKKVLEADSTENAEKALQEQDISSDTYIDFISALARAESESSRVSQAPAGQPIGPKLPE